MPLVEALNSHPYGGRWRVKGESYDVTDDDLELMIALKRVRRANANSQAYQTRHMEAGIVGTRGHIAPPDESKSPRKSRSQADPKTDPDQT